MLTAPFAGFLALAFALTWLCWLPAVLLGGDAGTAPWKLLLQAGSAGPLLATLIVLARQSQHAARARWRRRLTNLAGLASPAGALCILLPVLIGQLALDSFAATGGFRLPPPRFTDAISLVLPTLLFGALPEELGWRGYALPTLAHGRDPLAPTVLLACVWGLWKLPLFFMQGTYESGIELDSASGLLYFVNIIGESLLMTSFYLATRCTWAAVLFHGLTTLMGEWWQLPVVVEMHRTLWTLVLAGIVLLVRPPFGVRRPEAGNQT